MKLYNSSSHIILQNKRKVFPLVPDEPLLQKCLDLDTANLRSRHIADLLDPQGVQENVYDSFNPSEITFTDRHPGTFETSTEGASKVTLPKLKIRSKQEVHCEIRSLDRRQRLVFDYVAKFIHDCTRKNEIHGPRLIVQGEAGTGKSLLISCTMNYALHKIYQSWKQCR